MREREGRQTWINVKASVSDRPEQDTSHSTRESTSALLDLVGRVAVTRGGERMVKGKRARGAEELLLTRA